MFTVRSNVKNEEGMSNNDEKVSASNEEQILSDINKLRQRLNWLDAVCDEQTTPRKRQISFGLDQIRQQLDDLELLVNDDSKVTHVVLPSENEKQSSDFGELTPRLFKFIEEQAAFNRRIEQRLVNSDEILLADLNAAYRKINHLQSEINHLQSENAQLLSTLKHTQKSTSFNDSQLQNSRTSLTFGSTSKLNLKRLGSMENIASPRPTPTYANYTSLDDQNLRNKRENSTDEENLVEISAKIDIQLLSFLRYHLKEKFNQYLLDLIRDQTICLIKDKIMTNSTIESTIERYFHEKFQKYLGLSVRKHGTNFLDELSLFVRQILIENKNQTNNDEHVIRNLSAESKFNRQSLIFIK